MESGEWRGSGMNEGDGRDCGDGQTKPGVTLALVSFCFEERPTMRGS